MTDFLSFSYHIIQTTTKQNKKSKVYLYNLVVTIYISNSLLLIN